MKIVALTKKQIVRLRRWYFACFQEMPLTEEDFELVLKFFGKKAMGALNMEVINDVHK